MDTLLEKLRAAAPQTRDTRDRRRRARLNDRHQKRVASGQQIPDIAGVPNPGAPTSEDGEGAPDTHSTVPQSPTRPGSSRSEMSNASSLSALAAGDFDTGAISEGEDVADRAASLMQSLRGNADPDADPPIRDDSLRVRRRRESADDERTRRRRRRAGQSSTSEATTPRPTIPEEVEGEGEGEDRATNEHAILPDVVVDGTGSEGGRSSLAAMIRGELAMSGLETPLGSPPLGSPSLSSPPITIVSPPSPTLEERWGGGGRWGGDGEGREGEGEGDAEGKNGMQTGYHTPLEFPTPAQTPREDEEGEGEDKI